MCLQVPSRIMNSSRCDLFKMYLVAGHEKGQKGQIGMAHVFLGRKSMICLFVLSGKENK